MKAPPPHKVGGEQHVAPPAPTLQRGRALVGLEELRELVQDADLSPQAAFTVSTGGKGPVGDAVLGEGLAIRAGWVGPHH
jgi:hypothetical protein